MAQPLTDSILALTRYANETTGASDTTLSDAVETLVEGYGQGGGENHETDILSGELSGEYTNEDVIYLKNNALSYEPFLTKVNFPNLETVNGNALYNCQRLAEINLPKLRKATTNYNFASCPLLERFVAPSIYGVFGAFSFQYDRALSIVDCGGSFDGFGGQVFTGCSVLKTLILRPASLVSLGNINNFNSTPFASGGTGGTLYVPQSLISSYQSATNWSTILGYANNQILPIEGSIYETQYADGTPIE